MKTTLYNIEKDYLMLISQIEEAEGEITPQIEEQLTINETQLQGKSVAYLQVITTKEGINEAIDIEIKRLQAIKRRNNNLIDKLKDRLLEAVKLFGEFEVGFNKFGTRKSTSVQIDDIDSLPSKFTNVKITVAADKKAIKDAIKSGKKIKGCSIINNLNLKIG